MQENILLADFGASRIKFALWSHYKKEFINKLEYSAPEPTFGSYGQVEILPQLYWDVLQSALSKLFADFGSISQIWICSEMHGSLIINESTGDLVTPYISWKDERAAFKKNGYEYSTIESIRDFASIFRNETGMRLRSGLPFVTTLHFARENRLPKEFRVLTIVDWLLWKGGEKKPKINRTLAAGTGFYSLMSEKWSTRLIEIAGLNQYKIHLPDIANVGELLGNINILGKDLEIYGGFGDLQTAALGAGFPIKSSVLINIGTGSQVMCCQQSSLDEVELRPSINNGVFSAITHIPAGRAINVFANFIDECSKYAGSEPIFWKIFSNLKVNEVLNADPCIDLNIFNSSWQYDKGGSIKNIHESSFSVKSFLCSLAHSWLLQYAHALQLIDPKRNYDSFILSGGLSRRCDFIVPVLEFLTNRKAILPTIDSGEETLEGLLYAANTSI